MPEPIRRSRRYMPGLDGLRALAVLAVIAYHLGFGWAPGGLLGVGVFFTLSGYLITDLLLEQWARGRRRLADFWLGRARRLLPALFAMLVAVFAWVTVFGPPQPPNFRDAVAAAALYVSNWQLIFQHVSYFARFGPPSALNHLWSLAVEEQFYIFWPFLLLLGTRFVREPSPGGLRPRLAGVTLLGAAASAIAMALLYHPSLDPSRVYYGTDTRACELLAGAALAMVWPSRRLRRSIAAGGRRALDAIGVLGLLGIGLLIWRTNEYSPFLFRGGFVLLALSTVLVVAALAHPACRLGPILGWAPLRWIGVRSYGIYLWHYPIIVLTTPAGAHGTDLLRGALQVAATFAVAALSWRYVEEPVRHGALGRLWAHLRSGGWRPEAIPRRGWIALSGAFTVFAVAGAGLAGAGVGYAPAGPPVVAVPAGAALAGAAEPVSAPARSWRTSCRAVVHIGDSTSEGLVSAEYLPPPHDRIDAQYARVGAAVQHFEISGARSIVESYEGEANAYEVARAWKGEGYDGCWVLALGTNDTADVYVGSNTGRLARIEQMMAAIGRQPVLWVNVKSLEDSGPYAEQNMRLWNEALLEACPRYPNMRVFDWAATARDAWFIDDGIHYTSPGYKARSHLIAAALAAAFPASPGRGAAGCVVPAPPARPPQP
jgi:peptidoglycan/LPS O-acetylase OafA/YrhL